MKKLLLIATLLAPTLALAQLEWRLSVKFILDANGHRPTSGSYITDQQVSNAVQFANQVLDRSGRGYRYTLVEITNVAGISQWFNSGHTNKDALEGAAESGKSLYRYRDNAINVYINGWGGTAVCSFPSDDLGNDIIFMGQSAGVSTFAHEGGHYFSLYHTFFGQTYWNTNESDCPANDCTCTNKIGGNTDGITDTINDNQCWFLQNDIAQGNYHVNYGSPGCDDAAVDRLFHNVMSYRGGVRELLTPDQMDRATDISNDVRFKVATGRTRFVDRNGTVSMQSGTSTRPYKTVGNGLSAAQAGDIVLIRPGHYHEPMTITARVTLRATRGSATIGVP